MAWHGAHSIRALGTLALGLPPLGITLLLSATHWPTAVLLFALLYGTGQGLVTIVKALIPTVLAHATAYARLAGWIAAPGLVTCALAPALTAIMIETTDARLTLFALTAVGTLSVIFFLACLSRN